MNKQEFNPFRFNTSSGHTVGESGQSAQQATSRRPGFDS